MKRLKRFNEGITDKMTPKSQEEVSSALKKLHEDYVFKTPVSDFNLEYHILKGVEDIEYIELDECFVYWDYELNNASWGINYIMPKISKITLTVTVNVYNEEKDFSEEIKKDFLYDIMNADIDTQEADGVQQTPYAPQEISISQLEAEGDNQPQILILF